MLLYTVLTWANTMKFCSLVHQTTSSTSTPSPALDVIASLHHDAIATSRAGEGVVWYMRLETLNFKTL